MQGAGGVGRKRRRDENSVDGNGAGRKRQDCGALCEHAVLSASDQDDEVGDVDEERVELWADIFKSGPHWPIHNNSPPPTVPLHFHALHSMSQALWQQAQTGSDLTDMKFVFPDDSVLHGHRSVLSARSSTFRKMFQNDMEEGRTGRVCIKDFSQQSFRVFLHCVYTGSIGENVEGTDGRELWGLSDKYEVHELQEWLLRSINEASVTAAAQFAHDIGDADLTNACAKSAAECLHAIQMSFLAGISVHAAKALIGRDVQELDAFKFAEKWYNANADTAGGRGGDVQLLLEGIDFSYMSSHALRTVVKPSGLLSADALIDLYEGRLSGVSWCKQRFHPITSRGSLGRQPGMLNTPAGVALMEDGSIITADRHNQRLVIFGPDGTCTGTFGSTVANQSIHAPPLREPVGVAVSPDGKIFVSDVLQHRIMVYTVKGRYEFSFGSRGGNEGEFQGPRGIAVGADGEIFVSDQNNHRIQIFDREGRFLRMFGSFGSGTGCFNQPFGLAVSPEGDLIVADQVNSRIQIFRPDGTFVREIGPGSPDGPYSLSDPVFVCVSLKGVIVVSDYIQGKIHIFTPEGEYIQGFGEPGESPGQFLGPCGVAVGASGSIIVADSDNDRIQVMGRI